MPSHEQAVYKEPMRPAYAMVVRVSAYEKHGSAAHIHPLLPYNGSAHTVSIKTKLLSRAYCVSL